MRIDKFLSEKYRSRTQAAEYINRGLVLVNGKKVTPSYEVKESDDITFVQAERSFVSLGGYKLQKAFEDFGYSPKGKIFADIGASTGGFTDCLLQNGAEKVYCIDVGESQLDKSLLDKNVVVIDNYNARNTEKSLFCEVLCGAVIDVSFISLTYLLKAVSDILPCGGVAFALIKPQFECDSRKVGKNGIVRDSGMREKAVRKIYDYALSVSLAPTALTGAPEVKGKNKEFVVFLVKDGAALSFDSLKKSVKF